MIDPQGIATDGSEFWIVDREQNQVLRFGAVATATVGIIAKSDSFTLHSQNTSASGITTDGDTIWITDDVLDAVFVYSMGGSYLGHWMLDGDNADASGITNNPAGGTSLWVVDRANSLVYHYDTGTTLVDGYASAANTFTLAAANAQPEGIADPPELQVTSPTDGVQVSPGVPMLITGRASPGDSLDPVTNVTVNGVPADSLDAAGNFFAQVMPAPGHTTLEITAFNALHETVSTAVTLEGVQSLDHVDFEQLSDLSDSLVVDYGAHPSKRTPTSCTPIWRCATRASMK